MNIEQVEEELSKLVKKIEPKSFIFDLLTAYGKPKATVTKLQKGIANLSKKEGEIIWKKNLWFRPSTSEDVHLIISQLQKSPEVARHALRFLLVTDWETLVGVDTKTNETLDIPITELGKRADFFLPWTGREKQQSHNESHADVKAAYKMGKLYDQICKDNPNMSQTDVHSLNVFLSRLLFCFFAEDTDIFPVVGMFSSSIGSHTQEDGSDLHSYLDKLFMLMNNKDRSGCPGYLKDFPYVNGGLFAQKFTAPKLSRLSRKLILECGDLNWSEINPDIFGSMIQAVVQSDHRDELGMHYTSVSNIMKVIEPLFLSELRESFQSNYENFKGLERLRTRLSKMTFFDPACGSGNFLIIAFKELRRLETDIFLRLREIDPNYQTMFTAPMIQLTQFYGLEVVDFAHEIAILSLWLAEHQMNVKFKENLGIRVPPLPLKPSGHIVCGNATRSDWNKVCPLDEKSELYILGNPPYLGSSNQDDSQKDDIEFVFEGSKNYKNLDYVSCWFYNAAKFIQDKNAVVGFVCTNSICEGEQVEMLWPHLFEHNLEISFAYQGFNWTNNAKHNAGISVAIIGLRNKKSGDKLLFSDNRVQKVPNISPYLLPGPNSYARKRSKVISILPEMTYGSKPVDDGNLLLSYEERQEILKESPEAAKFIKKILGSQDFINGLQRWCIWVEDAHADQAAAIPSFHKRFEKVRKFRKASTKVATQNLAKVPYKFGEPRLVNSSSIIIPIHSSENREYAPVGFLDKGTVISNAAFAIYDPEPWVFAVLISKMHNAWFRLVGGRIRTDLRYSNQLCYNTFPLPNLTQGEKDVLATHAFNVLAEREKHPEKTIADLYNPERMPPSLLKAHRDLDAVSDRLYRAKVFSNSEDRTQFLLKTYEDMLVDA